MLLGALPFAWYIRALNRRRFHSEQIGSMLRGVGIVILTLTIWLIWTRGSEPLTALRLVAFNVVSVVTTTGYATTDYTAWGPFAVVAFFFLTAVGGCTGSTSGGVKAMRWLLFWRAMRVQIGQIVMPHAVVPLRYEGREIDQGVLSGVVAFFIFFAVTLAGLTLALDLLGLNFYTALSGALTALTNVGPGVGPIIGPAGNFAPLNDAAKLVLALGMYLGRLEMLTVFVLLTPVFWRELRRAY